MDKKFNPEKLTITDFKVIKGEIEAPFEFDCDAIKDYETDLSFNASFIVDKKIIKADIGFVIETNSSTEQKEAKAKFDLVYVFKVENLQELIVLEEEKIVDFELALLTAIAAISFSTSRGVFLTRLKGTALKDYMLPVIDPKKLLAEWIEVKE